MLDVEDLVVEELRSRRLQEDVGAGFVDGLVADLGSVDKRELQDRAVRRLLARDPDAAVLVDRRRRDELSHRFYRGWSQGEHVLAPTHRRERGICPQRKSSA